MSERAHTKGRERPILFSAPMVRALLDGRKTQTRRVLGQFDVFRRDDGTEAPVSCLQIEGESLPRVTIGNVVTLKKLKAAVGDRLWVREAFSYSWSVKDDPEARHLMPVWYWADDNPDHGDWSRPKPSIHMPRWASRLTLTVTNVRVQRINDIKGRDIIAEGVRCDGCYDTGHSACRDGGCFAQRIAFENLWDGINGLGSWDANPWVAAYTFTVERRNIDAPTKGEASDVG